MPKSMSAATETVPANPLELYRAAAAGKGGERGVPEDILDAAIDHTGMLAAAVVPPTCPDWCELEPGHQFQQFGLLVSQEAFERDHRLELGVVRIEAEEWQTWDGVTTVDEPYIWIDEDKIEVLLPKVATAADAYRLGDALIVAAHRLEQIKAGQL